MQRDIRAHVAERDIGSVLRRSQLEWLDLELTERCDNACRHCCVDLPLDDADALGREMTTERVLALIDEAVELGLLTLRISGGEPLVREDFEAIYLHARRRGVAVVLCTNARRITPRLAALFKRIPPLRPVEITVYGMSEASYETMTCRRGSYEEFRRGVALLSEAGVTMRLNGAFRPPHLEEMKALLAWAEELPTVVGTPDQVLFYDLRRRREPGRNEAILRLRADPDVALAASAEATGHEAVSVEFCRTFLEPGGDRLFACGAGHRPCVDPYGDVHACTSLRHPDLAYHLEAGSLEEAVTTVFPQLDRAVATDPAYLQRCARCFIIGLCQQCPARSYTEHGVLDRPVDYQCEVAQAQARRLGLLAAGERPWEVTDWKERIRCLKE